ncbi:NAD(P)H-flavin reductase [Colwellia sp. PAMC 20917]|jgi:aquacobalamin reductase/NAD(P)H-flavin reductase|uniref:NAD(P)H-flavin reductase n=1 Tax=unclassified Colwellia TaxID=196834 RepID=UPI000878E85F|nr:MULTISPECIES: NAD(P)H-flavin reductase [unclassified Colwellia]MBA6363242.1 NAD(P)H-flavin reductase [Colwellia sp. BRX8-8]AOW77280.1 NAD(P)H-flavin reductase [Colwellia sp. PAMC 20917]MBA6338230.1 NAD(P)H-flavin reductase [Colwellia sp. BRX8-7]MBA6347824.1 NAD(P)H-flavin reductase [Colwellia sp. BRX8-9]MBA6351817.1 NAD(P)H-flavin reductase [Colwellia sp. BRX9-1]|tara:strand:- start:2494 stop:3189 length:696 start_codon:yes stop_codon:yes gene_type:complete
MNKIKCQVESLTSLTEFVYKVLLKPSEQIDFQAGQYLNFVMSEDDKRPFSIASAPNAELIELQIGASGADSYPMQVIEHIKANNTVTVEMPLGNAQLRSESERPLLLLAGGTGFSYIKSMYELLASQRSSRKITVYWGLRDQSACYELEKTAKIIAGLENGTFHPVVENPDDNWQGQVGMVHHVVMKDIKNLADYDIYLAGRFDMVGAVRTDFLAQGALVEHMFADAFAYI